MERVGGGADTRRDVKLESHEDEGESIVRGADRNRQEWNNSRRVGKNFTYPEAGPTTSLLFIRSLNNQSHFPRKPYISYYEGDNTTK